MDVDWAGAEVLVCCFVVKVDCEEGVPIPSVFRVARTGGAGTGSSGEEHHMLVQSFMTQLDICEGDGEAH